MGNVPSYPARQMEASFTSCLYYDSFYGLICTTFLTHWAWILCAEKLSGSNAFWSRTVRGLNHNPCFNGIWKEFCQTSPSAGQKRRECGNKHPTGGSVPLIPSINKRWIVWNFDDGRPLLNKSWCEDWGIHVIILEYFNSYWGSFFSP